MLGYGYQPYFVEGDDPETMHLLMAATLDKVVMDIRRIQSDARIKGITARPRWPMIVFKSPKGWTGPKVVDGVPVEGTYRAHQVPLSEPRKYPEHLKLLESWMRSYRPEELFDKDGRLVPELRELAPDGERRMGANPHANGGVLLRDLRLPHLLILYISRLGIVRSNRAAYCTGQSTRSKTIQHTPKPPTKPFQAGRRCRG